MSKSKKPVVRKGKKELIGDTYSTILGGKVVKSEGEQSDPFAANGGSISQPNTQNMNDVVRSSVIQQPIKESSGSILPSSPGAAVVKPVEPQETPDGCPTPEPEADDLKGDQVKAFYDVIARVKAGKRFTKLCGFAGTGKTFLLTRIAKWAERSRLDVTVVAPTHKAAGVIKSKLDADVKVGTIHSLLGLKLEPDFTNDTGGRVVSSGDGKAKPVKGLVICDEASMVGATLKKHVDALPNVSWLFVGDLAQLPPVGEDISELLYEPDVTLSTVLRQAQGSEILNLVTRLRNGDLSMQFKSGFDVRKVTDAEALFQSALDKFKSDEHKKDAAFARMLVFRNDRRKAVNSRMRSILVGVEEPYTADEWLVLYSQFSPEKSRLNVLSENAKQFKKGHPAYGRAWSQFFRYKEQIGSNVGVLHTSEEVLVKYASPSAVTVSEWTFSVWRLTVQTRSSGIQELPVLTDDEELRVINIKQSLADMAIEARKNRDQCPVASFEWMEFDKRRKQSWATYFCIEETFAQVDYAYAMTVHKSQGSTFDHVFVDVPDLLLGDDIAQKILYTACTRPSKSLTFYM